MSDSDSDYESDQNINIEDVKLEESIKPTRKKFSPIKPTEAKKAQALINLAKARLTRQINAKNKQKEQANQYKYTHESDSSESSEEEIVVKKSKKVKTAGLNNNSSLDEEFKKSVLQQLSDLKRKQKKKTDRQTIINLPSIQQQSFTDPKKKALLNLFD
jgi:Fe2+ transport system protein B